MKTPLDLVLRNWRTKEHSVHVDRLAELAGCGGLAPEERSALLAELAATEAHGVLLDADLSWHLVETKRGDVYLVSARSQREACSVVHEETGLGCWPVGPRSGMVTAKVLVPNRT